MFRICLLIAVVAGIAAVGLNVVLVRDKVVTITADRNDQKTQKEKALSDLGGARRDLQATKTKLAETETTLQETKKERDTAVAKADLEVKRASDLADKLNKATQERDDAQSELAAYRNTGFKPEQVANLGKQMKGLQDEVEALNIEKKILARNNNRLSNKLRELLGEDNIITMPATAKGKVLVADPKWDFVVLDVGADQGATEHGELLVSRDGKLVAKLRIETVEKGRSIANILPGWKLSDVMEGDQVIPAYLPPS